MLDQAAELRQRMHTLAECDSMPAAAPRSLVVCGAMRDVGATTTAVNLTVELVRHGRRVVLIDAEPTGDATRLCRLPEPSAPHGGGLAGASLSDVYRGRRPLAAVILRGSHGLRVVGNSAGIAHDSPPTDDEIATLSDEISKLSQEADLVVVDSGCGDSPVARRLATDAAVVLLATTTADAAIMETYASIKRMTAAGARAKIAVIMSRAGNLAEAENAFGRLTHGCRRFLGISIDWAGCVLDDTTVADAALCAAPFVVLSPRCEAARGIQQAAEYLQGVLSCTSAKSELHTAAMNEKHDVEQLLATISEAA